MKKDKNIMTRNVKVKEKTWLELMMMKYKMGLGTVGVVVDKLLRFYKTHEMEKKVGKRSFIDND